MPAYVTRATPSVASTEVIFTPGLIGRGGTRVSLSIRSAQAQIDEREMIVSAKVTWRVLQASPRLSFGYVPDSRTQASPTYFSVPGDSVRARPSLARAT